MRRLIDLRNRILLAIRDWLDTGQFGAKARTRKASMKLKVIRKDGTEEPEIQAHTP